NNLISKSKLINDIKEFLSKSNLYVFVQKLIDQGFRIFLVSDHGNIFAKGNGVHASKDLVNEKARRFMIFDHMELSTEYETEKTELLQFKNIIGDQWLLLETQNEMFDNLGQEQITHGGISGEEVIVPFIKVVRK
ncbi:MAG TPA: PglZ domain-containing protein, partial [Euryarchaeota archaeon]|nr:PglZ domain-containing protein [Euryarchaeota archaeon]